MTRVARSPAHRPGEGGALGWSNALVVVGVALFVVSLPAFSLLH